MSTFLETLASHLPHLVIRRHLGDSNPPDEPARYRLRGALLFADITGFTALTEQLAQRGPGGIEDLTRLLNTFFGQILDTISAAGGDVLTFAGDALLALWPVADDDLVAATRSAAQCALAIHQRVADLYRLIAIQPLTLRVGVASGDLVALRVGGMYGRWLFFVTGDPLAEVGAAEGRARPGEVVLGPSAWALVRNWCAGSPAGSGEQNGPPGEYIRLESIQVALRAPPIDPLPMLPAMEPALRGYIAAAVHRRIVADQSVWLAELRRVTVLFINLPMMDQDTALEQAQLVVLAIQAALYRYEGSINKISLDDKGVTLVAALGLPPLAHEDDPARAVQAALAAGQALGEIGQRCAIGVTSGHAFCGEVGSRQRREYTMIGAIVNLAARLMQSAPVVLPDQDIAILCDTATSQAAQQRLAFDPLPPITVKGRPDPVAIFRPRLAAEAGRQSAAIESGPRPAIPARLVGRDAELTALAAPLAALRDGAAGGVILIEGEAGMGKSRLIEAIIQQAAQLRIVTFVGAGDAVDRSTPYSAWRGVFGQLFDLSILSAPEARRAHILSLIEDEEQILSMAALLNMVLPLELPESEATSLLSGPARAEATRELLLRVLQSSADRSPKLLILEDAHWFDASSWALALAVSQRVRPLLLIITGRPPAAQDAAEHQAAEYHQLAALARPHLRLEALPPNEALALVCQRLGVERLPEPVAALIREKAQGNPFFSEELAYALRDAGLLQIASGNANLAPDADLRTLSFPDSVQAAIVSRIDRLAPTQQLTLKVASVIGRVFPVRTLAAIYPISTSQTSLSADLQTLERLDITPLDAVEPDLAYSFKHAITQDVVYNLMLFAQRRQLHRAAAEWYEQTYADDLAWLYPLLAYHWNRAGVVERAIDYFERAGRHALAASAIREACTLFEQALGLLADTGAERRDMQLCWLLGEANRQLGEFSTASELFERSLAHARIQGDTSSMINSLSMLGRIATDRGDYELARTYLEEGYTLAHAAGEQLDIAQLSSNLGNMAMRMRRYDEADQHFQESLRLFTLSNDQPGIAQALNGMGNSAIDREMYDVALFCYEESLAIRRTIGDHWGIASCLNNLGWLAHLQYDYSGARSRYEEGLAIARSIGDQRGITIILNNLGFTDYALNDNQAAEQCFYEALHMATTIGVTPLLLELLVGIAGLRARAGQAIEAAELIGLATNHPSRSSTVYTQANLLLEELGLLPPPPPIAAAIERGKTLDLAATVAALELRKARS